MSPSFEEAKRLLDSKDIIHVMVGLEQIKQLHISAVNTEVLEVLFGAFFYKSSTVKKKVLSVLRKLKPFCKNTILDYKHEIFKILYSNDDDSVMLFVN